MASYIQVTISNVNAEQSEIMIALLADIGYEGFEEGEWFLSAFINKEDFNEELLKDILTPHQLNFSKELIAEKNWNEEWEKNFEPVRVDDFCAVRAGFHQPITNVQHEVIITPKMSFGTGHHATTYMMIKSMQDINFKDKSVLDFGTGTGVLAILAEKLIAGAIYAIDNDEWSITNAKENIEINNCSAITVELKDNLNTLPSFDIVLANINRNVLMDTMDSIAAIVKPTGMVLLSGFYEEDVVMLVQKADEFELKLVSSLSRNKWHSLLFTKN
ncbi:MAG: 50S ribosomal protein L11 methyltransferase [Sphingobacteriales bacterium]